MKPDLEPGTIEYDIWLRLETGGWMAVGKDSPPFTSLEWRHPTTGRCVPTSEALRLEARRTRDRKRALRRAATDAAGRG